jgi:hypothetical protein
MFYPGSEYLFIPDPGGKKAPDPRGKKAPDPGSGSATLLYPLDPRSGIRKKFIPDLGGKKAPDPGSATLH